MERNAVADCEFPTQDAMLRALGFKVGRRLETRVLRAGVSLKIGKACGCEPAAPAMRAGDVLGAGALLDRVERNPEADDVFTINRVIGLVVMPGRLLFGARLLDQHMLVVQIDLG